MLVKLNHWVAPNFICHQSPIIIGETGDIGDIVDIDDICNIGETGETGEIFFFLIIILNNMNIAPNLQQESENDNEIVVHFMKEI